MILIGRNLSPYVRRVAISLRLLGFEYQQRALSTVEQRDQILVYNPLGRVPALVLEDGEVLIDSAAILDHLDETAGPSRALIPPAGPGRRAVAKRLALATGVTDKAIEVYRERIRRPPETLHEPHAQQCEGQVLAGLAALDAMLDPDGAITQAEITLVAGIGFMRKLLPGLMPEARFLRVEALLHRCDPLPAFAETRP